MLLCCLLTPSAAVATAHASVASVAGALAVGGLSGVGRNLMRMVLNHQKNHRMSVVGTSTLNSKRQTLNPKPSTTAGASSAEALVVAQSRFAQPWFVLLWPCMLS